MDICPRQIWYSQVHAPLRTSSNKIAPENWSGKINNPTDGGLFDFSDFVCRCNVRLQGPRSMKTERADGAQIRN